MTPSEQMLDYVRRITIALEKMSGSNQAQLNLPQNQVAKEIPKCPLCNESMVLRKRKNDGSDFWGCRSYPDCKGTRNADGTPTIQKTKAYTTQPSSLEEEDVPF